MKTFKQFLSEWRVAPRRFKIDLEPALRKEILRWIDSYGVRGYKMNSSIEDELMKIDNVRSSVPITIYRGMYFSKSNIKKKPEAQRVLKAAQSNSKNVKLNFTAQSSWTFDKDVALEFANKYAFHDDGILGVVVSMIVNPSDVIVELGRVIDRDRESEVIIKSGSYDVQVVSVVEGDKYVSDVGFVNRADHNSESKDAEEGKFQVGQVFSKPGVTITITKVNGSEVTYVYDGWNSDRVRAKETKTSPAKTLAHDMANHPSYGGAFKLSHNANWKIKK